MIEKDITQQQNKRAILKSTTLLGGSSIITILIGMVKTKIIAMLLGPTGVGFIGVLTSLIGIITIMTGFGLSSSGVRQVASSVSRNDNKAISTTVRTIKIMMWVTGSIGMLVMVIGSNFWSVISFKTTEYSFSIAFLGFAVFFNTISSSQTSLIQGYRRVGDVAKINIIGAFNALILSLPCYYFFGIGGVIPSLIISSFAVMITSWWFSKKIMLYEKFIVLQQLKKEAQKLIVFGIPMMFSALFSNISVFFIRIFLTREAGLDGVGQYQAAFSLSGVLVSFVLTAMGTDYYPRLTAIADDNNKINNEVNSQTEIALLLSVPALSITIVFMPIMIQLFYSSRFNAAIPILQWAVLGILGRVISWPLGFIMLAKAKGMLFLLTEAISGIFHVLAVIVCYQLIGLKGSGLAFALLYFFYIILMLFVSYRLAHVRWHKNNIKLIIISIAIIIILSFLQHVNFSEIIKYIIGIAIILMVTIIFFLKLLRITGLTYASKILKIYHMYIKKNKKVV